MRPISVRYSCFGPYMEEQYIDFELLSRSGLFLICGETGAGKTTMLDAMCYALYGKSSGGARGDLAAMRCKQADRTDETRVEFIFEAGGKRYMFTRRLWYGSRKGAKNLKDEHNCLVWTDGSFVPIYENPTQTRVNDCAAEIIGLSYDQFRQVIILPQGQFEKLLVSESADKERILVSLFRADRWQNAVNRIKEKVDEREGALKQRLQEIRIGLSAHGCDSLEGLAAGVDQHKEQLDALEAQAGQAEEALRSCKRSYEAGLLADKDFAELAKRERTLAALVQKREACGEEERRLARADQAAQIKPEYDALMQLWQDQKRAQAEAEQAASDQTSAQARLAAAAEEHDGHEAGRELYERTKRNAVLLGEAREVYARLAQTGEEALRAQAEERGAEKVRSNANAALADCDAVIERCSRRQEAAMEAYRSAQTGYIRSVGGRLAQKLQPGMPCPVCGSCEHPSPAKPGDADVTDAQLDACEKEMTGSVQAFHDARQARQKAEAERNRAEQLWQQACQAVALAVAAHEHARSRCIQGIDNSEQLEKKIAQLDGKIARYEARSLALQQQLTEARTQCGRCEERVAQAQSQLSRLTESLRERTEAWKRQLADYGFESNAQFKESMIAHEELQRRRTAVMSYRAELRSAEAALEEQQARLEGREAPDLAQLKAQYAEAEAVLTGLREQSAMVSQRIAQMRRDHTRLSGLSEACSAERLGVEEDRAFVNHLMGSRGVSLQRYVLGVMLTAITHQANRLLENVHGGRYRLYRTDEGSGSSRKKGLELEVLDSLSNTRRSVSTLSGGEKFLVSLSLAIGLSTVVQAQGSGVRMEAMFVDEGFGSLDAQSINDALEVLQTVQRSKGMVGIISHVERLRETIPARIEITKGRNGSQSRICV